MKKKIQTKISKYEEKKKTKFFSKENRVKIIIWVLAILCIFLIIGLSFKYLDNNNTQTNTQKQHQNLELTKTDNPNLETTPIIKSGEITESSKLEDFYTTGKPSFIVFAGTYCGHCQKLLPELETEIWDNYADKANIWVNVIDGKDGEKFEVNRIAQGFNPNLDYQEIMGDCSYVPAYVVLDKEGNQILRSCGGEKTIAEIKAALDSQLN